MPQNYIAKSEFIDPAKQVTFRCRHCETTFTAEPDKIEDNPALSWHPYDYFAQCSFCDKEVPQVAWEKNLYKAHRNATGPRTPAGIAATAKNIDGHPTPEEAKRTRFNALKHGATAKAATYFPAKPGKYPQCEGCDVDFEYCGQQLACIRRTELMMRYLSAVESGDTSVLNEVNAINQANLAAIFQDMILSIIRDGVALTSDVYSFDKDGGFHSNSEIQEIKANPLLKPLLDFVSRNSMSLSDLNLTPQVQNEQFLEAGRLSSASDDRDQVNDLMIKQNETLDDLKGMIERSKSRLDKDPVYLEYQSEFDAQVVEVTSE